MAAPTAIDQSQRTIQSYEGFADEYAGLGQPFPAPNVEAALRQVADHVGTGGVALEIGSGPGWEADFIETLGVSVLRTDATARFLELQAMRGKAGKLLNVITDDLEGPYDAVIALCVLIHVPRTEIDGVLAKIAAALRPRGVFFVSMRDGDGETSGAYHTVYWRRDDFAARLEAVGLAVIWDEASIDCDDDPWISFIAQTSP